MPIGLPHCRKTKAKTWSVSAASDVDLDVWTTQVIYRIKAEGRSWNFLAVSNPDNYYVLANDLWWAYF